LIGLDYAELQQLIKNVEILHNEKQVLLSNKKVRIIKKGGGRQAILSTSGQIILTLAYLRHLITFQMLGIQFGVSESTANSTFNYWLPFLREFLPSSLPVISHTQKIAIANSCYYRCINFFPSYQ
jgi:hypothetical protein